MTDAMKVVSLLPFLLSIVAFRKRKGLMLMLMVITIVGFGISCNKNTKEQLSGADKGKYVRIAVVDNDGTKAYSKVMKVATE